MPHCDARERNRRHRGADTYRCGRRAVWRVIYRFGDPVIESGAPVYPRQAIRHFCERHSSGLEGHVQETMLAAKIDKERL